MNKVDFTLTATFIALFIILTSGCSGSSKDNKAIDNSITYSTTSSKGDYSEWNIEGNNLTATWNVVSSNGDIEYSYSITATCGAADASGLRSCTIVTGGCTDGTAVCTETPSGDFDMMVVPGVALFVHTDGDFDDDQLHIGFAKNANACSDDVSGDYTFIRTGLGLNENFGMYRSDANFVDILHSDFGFDSMSSTATPDVIYRTGSENTVLTDLACVNGVRTRSTGSSEIFRSMMTNSGLFILDFPAGQGGLLSFKTSNAANLSDFANKTFGGISFPDNSSPETISATTGILSEGKVALTTSTANVDIMPLNTTATLTNPAYPDFSIAPPTYNATVLSASYATPNDIPGLFKLDNLSDTGRVIIAALKFNDSVIGIGMVYNYRNTADINPATGNPFPENNLYNTGNFILFER